MGKKAKINENNRFVIIIAVITAIGGLLIWIRY